MGIWLNHVYIDKICNKDIWTKMDQDCVPVERSLCTVKSCPLSSWKLVTRMQSEISWNITIFSVLWPDQLWMRIPMGHNQRNHGTTRPAMASLIGHVTPRSIQNQLLLLLGGTAGLHLGPTYRKISLWPMDCRLTFTAILRCLISSARAEAQMRNPKIQKSVLGGGMSQWNIGLWQVLINGHVTYDIW